MALQYTDVLTEDEISYILSLQEVREAEKRISEKDQGTVYFTVSLPTSIKEVLEERLGLNLTNVRSIPMRWIKGDTLPHVDRGPSSFENTYLMYLNNSAGELVVGEDVYTITQDTAYVFAEGLHHETRNTGSSPRLLLGPMNEFGQAVGAATTIYADGATEIIYFTYIDGSGLFYRINSGSEMPLSLPITIQNTNPPNMLKVYFDTNITVQSDILYFICGSSHIQFGSTSLKDNGLRPTITIDGVSNYPGLIQNGSSVDIGNNNIKIVNLAVTATGSTLEAAGGWIAQSYFGKGATGNTIVNCYSDGDISDYGGGIVGEASGSLSGELNIIGCSSSGVIGTYAGGIIGHYAGQDGGTVNCEMCWSEGLIGNQGGGIFGDYAGVTSGTATATKCYSTGSIQTGGGGIFGGYAGENNGQAIATKCYSRGNIGTNAGGIFGSNAGRSGGQAIATNCYSSGSVTTSGTGIYGSSKVNGTETNCYIANGSWSSVSANTSLAGTPSPIVGATWVITIDNQPYELNEMGYTPYTVEIIDTSYDLIQNYSQTIQPGQNTVETLFADASGNAVAILQKAGGDTGSYSSITMSLQTGVISTTSSTVPGTYVITLYSIGSYNITTFTLTVTESTTDSCCVANADLKQLDYTTRNQIVSGRQLVEEQSRNLRFTSYSDYYYRMMARASKK